MTSDHEAAALILCMGAFFIALILFINWLEKRQKTHGKNQ
jgi:hypothetical protein